MGLVEICIPAFPDERASAYCNTYMYIINTLCKSTSRTGEAITTLWFFENVREAVPLWKSCKIDYLLHIQCLRYLLPVKLPGENFTNLFACERAGDEHCCTRK